MTGHELKAKRKSLGLTQDLLAQELSVSRPTISIWEKRGDQAVDRIVFLAMEALTHNPELRVVIMDGVYIK